jgi:hypothetical protein
MQSPQRFLRRNVLLNTPSQLIIRLLCVSRSPGSTSAPTSNAKKIRISAIQSAQFVIDTLASHTHVSVEDSFCLRDLAHSTRRFAVLVTTASIVRTQSHTSHKRVVTSQASVHHLQHQRSAHPIKHLDDFAAMCHQDTIGIQTPVVPPAQRLQRQAVLRSPVRRPRSPWETQSLGNAVLVQNLGTMPCLILLKNTVSGETFKRDKANSSR